MESKQWRRQLLRSSPPIDPTSLRERRIPPRGPQEETFGSDRVRDHPLQIPGWCVAPSGKNQTRNFSWQSVAPGGGNVQDLRGRIENGVHELGMRPNRGLGRCATGPPGALASCKGSFRHILPDGKVHSRLSRRLRRYFGRRSVSGARQKTSNKYQKHPKPISFQVFLGGESFNFHQALVLGQTFTTYPRCQ